MATAKKVVKAKAKAKAVKAKAKPAATDDDDLIGDTKPSKKAASKANGKAKPKAAASNRGEKGSGTFFFPKDGSEWKALEAKLKKLTKPATTRELAAKLDIETWKVRLVGQYLVREKVYKKESREGGAITFHPK